ncbi:nucleoside triphosphate hydrolase protein [Wolfiporia cocos MD-104 SS10]|uniref:DNA 3'-5' helicase n=1 Tax=Wolfiporia cocos (strain MD-104) TaxID=742152 RepID=A0A2H3JBY4_WOLCO|nr:nucleoside triphosphate hydrolase protein [Wolfiporia cocos MD-104 SS10]
MPHWTIERIRGLIQLKLNKCACLFQIHVALELYKKRNDVVAVAATGFSKTLSFWIPLLMALDDGKDIFIIIVTPLNLLGKQNVNMLRSASIPSIAVNATNANSETFRLQYIVFDEGHCIKEWCTFRTLYKHIGSLRYRIPGAVPFYVASATLPSPLLRDVSEILQLRPNATTHFLRSNDRPDIHLAVRPMKYSASSFRDLNFLIPTNPAENNRPRKFLIFFDSIKEAEAAVKHLWSLLTKQLRPKIKYFHSVMSPQYRDDEYKAFCEGDTWGLRVTDSFGMGLDVPDTELAVQWKAPPSLNTLWQQFGRQRNAKRRENTAKKRKRTHSQRYNAPAKRSTFPSKSTSSHAVSVPESAGRSVSATSDSEGSSTDSESVEQLDIPYTNVESLQPAMDDFLNAGKRGFGCRRKPITLAYSNDQRDILMQMQPIERSPQLSLTIKPRMIATFWQHSSHGTVNVHKQSLEKP